MFAEPRMSRRQDVSGLEHLAFLGSSTRAMSPINPITIFCPNHSGRAGDNGGGYGMLMQNDATNGRATSTISGGGMGWVVFLDLQANDDAWTVHQCICIYANASAHIGAEALERICLQVEKTPNTASSWLTNFLKEWLGCWFKAKALL